MNDIVLIAKAHDFAARKHAAQRRKGADQEPYVNHPAEVAYLVAVATDGKDPAAVAAAQLHDVIEDQDVTREEIAREFSEEIADLVVEVTDDKALPKRERKRLKIERAPFMSRRGKILKLSDITANLRSLLRSPPIEWSIETKREYLGWANQMAIGLRGVSAWLDAQFDEAARKLDEALTAESRAGMDGRSI